MHAILPGLVIPPPARFEATAAPDPRRGPRLCTLFRTGKLLSRQGETICRVRNVSPNGFMADICLDLVPGEAIVLELAEGRCNHAEVVWSQGGRFGAAFAVPQPISEIVGSSVSPLHRHRALRLAPKNAFVAIRHEGRAMQASIINISQTGVAVFAFDLALSPGSRRDLLVEINGLDPLPGLLCWADKGAAGIQFERPLSFEALSHWLWAVSLADRSSSGALHLRG